MATEPTTFAVDNGTGYGSRWRHIGHSIDESGAMRIEHVHRLLDVTVQVQSHQSFQRLEEIGNGADKLVDCFTRKVLVVLYAECGR